MAKYKIKKPNEGQPPYELHLLTSSRKQEGGKVLKVYTSGDSVELNDAQALSHASILEISDAQAEKLSAPEPEATGKKK